MKTYIQMTSGILSGWRGIMTDDHKVNTPRNTEGKKCMAILHSGKGHEVSLSEINDSYVLIPKSKLIK